MKRFLLVSLISDQTIPNVQVIKELRDKVTDFYFITTYGMEEKGTRTWIEQACQIEGNISCVQVDEYSFTDIRAKLAGIGFDTYDRIVVNLTGGTKIMTLVAYDFFKRMDADIYYVSAKTNDYISIGHDMASRSFSDTITLEEYLSAYGFSITKATLSGISFEQSERIFNAFLTLDLSQHTDALKLLQKKRSEKKGINKDELGVVADFLKTIGYEARETSLSKSEVRYLSGEWFEEYVGKRILRELDLNDNYLHIGSVLKKASSKKVKNNVETLLGISDDEAVDSTNEMDVMFMYNNRFYSIECKSSIIAFKLGMNKKGETVEKEYNILGETIYKSDSLSKRFGLYATTSIFTLTDFADYCGDKDPNRRNNKTKDMKEVINRANLSDIKLIDRKMLSGATRLVDLIVKKA